MSNENPQRDYVYAGDGRADREMAGRLATVEAAFLLPFLSPEMTLVDAGCGQGTITVGFGKELNRGAVVGFDMQDEHVERARRLAESEGIKIVTFEIGDLYRPPVSDASFDVAFANAVISHQSSPEAAIGAIKNLVKPGGLVALRDRGGSGVLRGQGSEVVQRGLDIMTETINRSSSNPYGSQVTGEPVLCFLPT